MNLNQGCQPQVLIRCYTYNQEKYIKDALNGFVMQQTNFPFVCLIVDDASTDKEPEVIKSFLQLECDMENAELKEIEEAHIIIAHHKKNVNCLMVVYLLKINLYTQKEKKMALVKPWRDACKYEAMCEGDDYWTDPLKLQKQVDIMESDSSCTLCCSAGLVCSEDGTLIGEFNAIPVENSRYVTVHELLYERGGLIPTCSMLYRNEMMASMPQMFKNLPVGDRPLRMWCAINGKVFYHKEHMVTYRSNSVGSYTSRVRQNKDLAYSVYSGMQTFFDNFDEYTQQKYHDDVVYIKNRESWIYYNNIHDYRSLIKCPYIKTFSKSEQRKIIIKNYIKLIPGILPVYVWIRKKIVH